MALTKKTDLTEATEATPQVATTVVEETPQAATTPIEETPKLEPAIVEPVANVYPTEFYIGSGIPYCTTCGEVFLTDMSGKPRCAESRSECPRNGNS